MGKRLQSIDHAVAPPSLPPPHPVVRSFQSCCRLYRTSSHTSACEFTLFSFILILTYYRVQDLVSGVFMQIYLNISVHMCMLVTVFCVCVCACA